MCMGVYSAFSFIIIFVVVAVVSMQKNTLKRVQNYIHKLHTCIKKVLLHKFNIQFWF